MTWPGSILASFLALALLAIPGSSATEAPRVEVRYDLRPGDHLTYRQVFEREGKSARFGWDFLTRTQWTNHALVLGERAGQLAVGFQRNREKAELLRFQPNGRDYLHEEQSRFNEKEAARYPHHAEANRLSPRGLAALPWSALRETWSELLFDLHEIAPLPPNPVRPGDTWEGGSLLGMSFLVGGWDRVGSERCLRLEGSRQAETVLQLRYWFCPESGIMPRMEFEGSYPVVGGRFYERLELELVQRRRGEKLKNWLAEPEVREGALAALAVSDISLPDGPDSLYSLLEGAHPIVQRKVLALAHRRHLPPPPVRRLATLLESGDPRVRALALRVLEEVRKDVARPLIERALDDEDYFVREAALAWVRDRLPPERALAIRTPNDARVAWVAVSTFPAAAPAGPAQLILAQTLDRDSRLPAESCGSIESWTADAIRGRRLPPDIPGTTVRAMASSPYYGWPYIMHVPEDYRGDEPMPLLIFLSGDSGRTLHGVGYSQETLPGLGYLTVFPHAEDYWWREGPTAKATALLQEVLRDFNVDTNRVYLAGSSNGGTGTVRYSTWWTDRLAASVSMMGAGPYTADGGEPPLVVNLINLALLLLHGEEDRTIRLQSDQELLNAVRQLNPDAPIRLHAFKGRGHDIIFDTDEGLTQPFLQRHRRDPFPRQLVFQTGDMRFPRRFWVEILNKDDGLAEVQGRIEEDNTIRVDTHGVKRLRLLLRPDLLPRRGRVRVVLNGKETFSGELPQSCRLLQESWQATNDPMLAYSSQLAFDVSR